MDDPRFAHVATDPRFKAIPKHARKVKIDARFHSMFTDRRFKVKYSVDRKGRRVKQTSNEDLRKYYQLEEDEVPGEAVGVKNKRRRGKQKKPVNEEEENEEEEEEEEVEEDDDVSKSAPDRGSEISSSEEEEEDSDTSTTDIEGEFPFNSNLSEQIEHEWGEVNVDYGEGTSNRLAACNMDWDRLSAQDLYFLFSSFKPQGGIVHSVTIYPSDFGLERMAEEDIAGPVELVEGGEGEEGGVEGEKYSREKLREYQLKRLQYYYAVVECDSRATAEHIYEQCDGLEYERSGGKLDLRFIPEGMAFDDRTPKSVATEGNIPTDFNPSEFVTRALQQSKVDLTWDETDPKRLKTTMRNFSRDDALCMDFQAYLASGSSGEGSEGEGEDEGTTEGQQIQKYRALLEEVDGSSAAEHTNEEEMEITWEPGLKETAEDLVKRRQAEHEEEQLAPWDKYLREKRQRKKERKRRNREKVKEVKGEEEENEEEKEEEVEGGLGFDDLFFQHDVTMATTHSKKSKEKLSRKAQEKQRQEKSELELLVMGEDEGREHFSLKGILKEEEKEAGGRKKRKRRNREKVKEVKGEEEENEEEKEEEVEGGLGFDDLFFQHDVTMATTHSKKSKEKLSRKAQEKQRQEKSELELLVMGEDEGREHFSLKGILKEEEKEAGGRKKRKRRRKGEEVEPTPADSFSVDVHDPRFSALYDSHLYAPDPSDPLYKPTKGMAAIMAERQKRRKDNCQRERKEEEKGSTVFSDPSIGSLVKSVKSKTTSFSNNHRKKLRPKH